MNIRTIDFYCQECEEELDINIEDMPHGVIVNYGMGLKDEELASAFERAFEKHQYKLIELLQKL